ncbi:MAG: alpha/beta family hydrolase [Ilumatobacteraceae bacterium]
MNASKPVKGILLYPGAGSDSNHSSLIRVEDALTPLPVRRADFGYRKSGRRAPDRAPVLLEAVRNEAADFAASLHTTTAELVLGGRSMGGRMCSIAVAGEPYSTPDAATCDAAALVLTPAPALPAAGLVLIAYPLHPPGRPHVLRTEHLPRLDVACLFISGTRDQFATPDELQQWTATIPGAVTHVWLEAKSHDLRGCDGAIAEAVVAWLESLTCP